MKRKAFYCICVAAPITFVGAVLAFYRCPEEKEILSEVITAAGIPCRI